MKEGIYTTMKPVTRMDIQFHSGGSMADFIAVIALTCGWTTSGLQLVLKWDENGTWWG